MRLTRLALRQYGPFAEAALTLDPMPGRINLVLAPNGAGKSVLRGAWRDLLFGIGARTPMDFRFGYSGMQVAAEGVAPDGTPFAFTRRKGRAGTLLGADDQPLDPGLLPRLLGGADQTLLERLFALDTALLREGGAGLLESGGALAEALLQAAGGLRRAQGVAQTLDKERNDLAPERRTASRPFYQALDQLKESRRALRAHLVKPAQWRDAERALEAAAAARDAAREDAAAAARALSRLERVRRLRAPLLRLDLAESWLAGHSGAPALPADVAETLRGAREARSAALRALAEDTLRREELVAQIAGIAPRKAWLERASRIAALREQAGAAEKARRDLSAQETALLAAEATIEEKLRELGLPWPAARAAELMPAPALLAQARRLLREYGDEDRAEREAPALLERHHAGQGAAAAALAALPAPRDAEALAALVQAVSAEGEPVALAARDDRTVAEARAQWAVRLATLPEPWRDLSTLRGLDVPSPDRLRRLASTLEAASAARREAEAAASRAAATLSSQKAERAALGSDGALPDAASLDAARALRQELWTALRGQAAPEASLLAFEAALVEADRIADRRFDEAERVGAAARLDAGIARQETETVAARRLADAAEAEEAAARAEWAGALAPLSVHPGTGLDGLREWLAARQAALDAAAALEAALALAAERQTVHDGAARRLAGALEVPLPAGPPTLALRLLLDRAGSALRADREAAAERARLIEAEATHGAALREAGRQATLRRQRLGQWSSQWQDVLRALKRPPDERPEDSETTLALLEALGPLVREARLARARRDAMRAEIAAFTEACAALCAELEEKPPADPVAAARILGATLEEEQAEHSRLVLLRGQAEQQARALEVAQRHLAASEARLRDVVAAAGAENVEDAEARIALSANRAVQEAARDAALSEIATLCDGLELEVLRAEQAAHPPDSLEAALAEAERLREAAETAREDAVGAHTQAARALHDLGHDAPVHAAVAAEQSALARLSRALEEAVVLQAARSMLGEALAEVQQAGDDATLRRIGAVFATLTDGAYPAVTSREDDRGVAHLMIGRRHPAETLAVDALSEGTRDQLFLALRLVAIEDHAAHSTPLPFLGDDILQSFDDARAAAAFRALHRFSETTQVILLTHHRHLAELARATLPQGALNLQSLPE
ncbi:AAA family ATPase [Pseudoroseomonas globiformis]|uniref:AAA family ATPase n=1 Tax=Teichococcus globiformis TaxID=2307229 RepID=A0ABV7G2H8_9PROT